MGEYGDTLTTCLVGVARSSKHNEVTQKEDAPRATASGATKEPAGKQVPMQG